MTIHGRLAKGLMLAALGVLLVWSIPSYRLVPFYEFWGLDLHNHQAFHTCGVKNNPYQGTGAQCGDVFARDMFYPPLLYFAFTWTRLFDLPVAIRIWSVAIGVGILASLFFWVRGRRKWPSWLALGAFSLLLLPQFPTVFAMERGNSDVIIVLMWTLAMALFASGRIALAGLVAGLSAATKLYPVMGCAVVGLGVVGQALLDRPRWRDAARFAVGGVAAVAAAFVLFLRPTLDYLSDEFSRYAFLVMPNTVLSHSIQQLAPDQKWLGIYLFGLLLAAWIYASVRLVRRDPLLVFAGGLAMSTFWAGVSYDYNLVTTYPLLALLFSRILDERSPVGPFAFLAFGLFVIAGPRTLFSTSPQLASVHLILQHLWLLSLGLLHQTVARESAVAPATSPAPAAKAEVPAPAPGTAP